MVRELSKSLVCFTICLLLVSFQSCTSYEEPYVVAVKNVLVKEANLQKISIDALLEIHNPNSVPLDLSKTELSIHKDEILLAIINQSHDTSMPGNSNFDLPLTIDVDVKGIFDGDIMKALSFGNDILSKRELEVQIKGHIYAGKDKVKLKIPINRNEVVSF